MKVKEIVKEMYRRYGADMTIHIEQEKQRPMNIFILEDDPTRINAFGMAIKGHKVTVASGIDQAKMRFKPPYDLVLLDHDLGGATYSSPMREDTGNGFVKWLVAHDPQIVGPDTFFIVHSFNYEGSMAMLDKLQALKLNIEPLKFVYGNNLLEWLRSRK